MMVWIAAASCLLALVPAVLFLRNLSLYAPLPQSDRNRAKCSVLIPARNEEANIALALRSVLQSDDVDLEVIVLDDDSTDRTAEIVREIADTDPRVRLETAAIPARRLVRKEFRLSSTRSASRVIRSSFSWTPTCAFRGPTRSRGSRNSSKKAKPRSSAVCPAKRPAA